ncbi:MAG TPA: diguanylate cyclase [Pyrinomonadaceae bacterium]|nr:diguanylate cyclase [Pyrinomonadaceae bacterium]
MPAAFIPFNEAERLGALREHDILDTPAEREYDDIVLLASQICGTPMATISLIDETRQWFKAKVGIDDAETSRETAFCAHAILDPTKTLVVNDATKDERFSDNPLVLADPNIRFYAGTPLLTNDDFALGTLCVIDDKPRELQPSQLAALEALGRQLSVRLELRRTAAMLEEANKKLESLSLTDELTGLYNRRGFLVHAEQQFKLFRSRETEHSLWLLVGDMDGLKQINDTYGHLEGSAAIFAIGVLLKNTLRETDILSRPAGDEFVAMLVNTTDAIAKSLPIRLQNNIRFHNEDSKKPYKIGISIGLVKVNFDGTETLAEIIKQADAAMYADKSRRKAGRVS